uniref:Secreted protein n=1 Tax=Syphacia muris TaxID=451379 RepID=A0A0N5AI91_9BILA
MFGFALFALSQGHLKHTANRNLSHFSGNVHESKVAPRIHDLQLCSSMTCYESTVADVSVAVIAAVVVVVTVITMELEVMNRPSLSKKYKLDRCRLQKEEEIDITTTDRKCTISRFFIRNVTSDMKSSNFEIMI